MVKSFSNPNSETYVLCRSFNHSYFGAFKTKYQHALDVLIFVATSRGRGVGWPRGGWAGGEVGQEGGVRGAGGRAGGIFLIWPYVCMAVSHYEGLIRT